MTVSLFWRIQTNDFDSWLNPDTDGLDQMMQSQGVLAYSLHRGCDDRNSAVVHYEFADRDAAESFENWYRPMSEEWKEDHPGSAHEVVDRWIGDNLPGYARQLSSPQAAALVHDEGTNMKGHIGVKATHSVVAGKVEDFKQLASAMIGYVEGSEPGYLSYQWYLSEDEGTCTIVGVLEDSDAVLNHLANIGEMIGPLADVAPATGIELYGDVSDELRGAVAPFGATISGHWNGFSR